MRNMREEVFKLIHGSTTKWLQNHNFINESFQIKNFGKISKIQWKRRAK